MNSKVTTTPAPPLPFLENSAEATSAASAPVVEGGKPNKARPQPKRPQEKRRRLTKFTAILAILTPTILAGLYYGLIASNQYAVEVRFAVRGINANSGNDLLGMVTGIPSGGSTTADSYILMDYIHSREMLEKLRSSIGLQEIYSAKKADYLSSFSTDAPIEEFVKYWKKMVTISFDSSSQIIVVEARAFSPEDAKKVASAVLLQSEELVNELSARARKDAVSHAEKEVARMEERLRKKRQNVRSFREKEQVIDPSKTAESRLTLLAQLEGELSSSKAKLNSLSQFMDADSPRIKFLTSKISALQSQFESERAKMGQTGVVASAVTGSGKGKSSGPLTGLLADYQVLLTDQEFSEKAYISALSSLEKARLEAGRQQRYLATFVRPSLPEKSLYPTRLLNIFLTLVVSAMLWSIGTLITYAIRDHAT